MIRAAVALLLVLAGCDMLFDLDRLQRRDDAMVVGDGGDASDATDALAIDATPCASPSGHDEDSDSVDDACDACPTVAPPGGGNANTDGDALPDHCDPRPSTPGDKIGKVWFFRTQSELDEFDSNNAVHSATNDLVAMGGNGFITSQAMFNPIAIELNVISFAGTGLTAETWIQQNTSNCRVLGADCTNGATDKGCVRFNQGLGAVFNAPASTASRLVMRQTASGLLCVLTSSSNSAMTSGTGGFVNASFVVATSASAQTSVTSLVVYTMP